MSQSNQQSSIPVLTIKPQWQGQIRRFDFPLVPVEIPSSPLEKDQLDGMLKKNALFRKEYPYDLPLGLNELRSFLTWAFELDQTLPHTMMRLSWKDDESDMIALTTDQDVSYAYNFAVRSNKPLSISIEKATAASWLSLGQGQVSPNPFVTVVSPPKTSKANNNSNNTTTSNTGGTPEPRQLLPFVRTEYCDARVHSIAYSSPTSIHVTLLNSGSLSWPKYTRLAWVSGSSPTRKTSFFSKNVGTVAAGHTVTIKIDFDPQIGSLSANEQEKAQPADVVPLKKRAMWRLTNGKSGKRWGQPVFTQME